MRIGARPWMALLLGIVLAGGSAKADPISDPVQLNPFLPGAFIAVAEVHSLTSDLGDEETVNSLALAGFQPNTGGAYADFTNGALGFDVVGSANGTGQLAFGRRKLDLLVFDDGGEDIEIPESFLFHRLRRHHCAFGPKTRSYREQARAQSVGQPANASANMSLRSNPFITVM
jgi:hypothetical protein